MLSVSSLPQVVKGYPTLDFTKQVDEDVLREFRNRKYYENIVTHDEIVQQLLLTQQHISHKQYEEYMQQLFKKYDNIFYMQFLASSYVRARRYPHDEFRNKSLSVKKPVIIKSHEERMEFLRKLKEQERQRHF